MTSLALPGVAYHRTMAGISQRSLAKTIGVSYQTIRRIEKGGNAGQLPLEVVCAAATALNTTVPELMSSSASRASDMPPYEELTYPEARLLYRLTQAPGHARTLSRQDREITLPKLLAKGHVILINGQPHPDPGAVEGSQ